MDEMTEPVDGMTELTTEVSRTGGGRYERSIETAQRDAEAARLKSRNMTYQQVGDALGVSKQAAHKMVERAMRDTLEEPSDLLRQLELMKLDAAESAAVAIMERLHYAHSNGRLVYMGDNPIRDDGPALVAINTIIRCMERRAKLLGLDSPTKLAVTGAMRYELVGIEMDDV